MKIRVFYCINLGSDYLFVFFILFYLKFFKYLLSDRFWVRDVDRGESIFLYRSMICFILWFFLGGIWNILIYICYVFIV